MGYEYVADKVEDIFISELGEYSAFIFEANLREMGHTRETLREEDLAMLVERMEADYAKIFRERSPPLKGLVSRAMD